MDDKKTSKQYVLNVFIVPDGVGSKVVSLIRQHNISGGTILQGMGTSSDKIMKYLHLNENHKEIVLIATNLEKSKKMMNLVSEKFKF